jgi:tetratricopeptide (TPR) repeat protein
LKKKGTGSSPIRRGINPTRSSALAQPARQYYIPKSATLWICLILAGLIAAIYVQATQFDFIILDDPTYVTANHRVQAGLTREALTWAVTTMEGANWHPLTWVSHMLDCQLYGLKPAGHHITSILLHIANALLLFLVLRRMTGDLWRSAWVAALFAVHPLHVEAVAWVAERKEVLSTLFGLLALWFYARYTEMPALKRYLPVAAALSLSLMAKPMWVTLPFLLLLLDFWPLGRCSWTPLDHKNPKASNRQVVWEKVPLICLSLTSCLVTLKAQTAGGAVRTMAEFTFAVRLQNALVAYVAYLWKMIWPSHLAFYYALQESRLPLGHVLAALALLVAISYISLTTARRRPAVCVGWLWYLGTLVPVIGLVQVGQQSMADRYTYLPLIGIFMLLAWGIPVTVDKQSQNDVRPAKCSARIALGATAILTILILTGCSSVQAGYWRNSILMCEHTLKVTESNYMAHNSLALLLRAQGERDRAAHHFREALKIAPRMHQAWFNMGRVLSELGRKKEAIEALTEGLRLFPESAPEECALGDLLAEDGRISEALAHYETAIRLRPNYYEAHSNLGLTLANAGRLSEAIDHYLEALRITPDDAIAHNNLANALLTRGDLDGATDHYTKALQIRPDFIEAHNNLGLALARQHKVEEALAQYRRALELKPDYALAHANLAFALYLTGDYAGAWREIEVCRKLGVAPDASLIRELSRKMPEPAARSSAGSTG